MTRIPPFEKFESQLIQLKDLRKRIMLIPNEREVYWVKVINEPFKKELLKRIDY